MTRFARIACLLLPLLLVGVQAVGTSHALTERHIICDEHGELVHAGTHPGSAPAPHPRVQSLPETEHGAHGCALVTGLCHASATSPAPSGVDAPPVEASPEPAGEARDLPLRAPPLEFAPKTSPPRPTASA